MKAPLKHFLSIPIYILFLPLVIALKVMAILSHEVTANALTIIQRFFSSMRRQATVNIGGRSISIVTHTNSRISNWRHATIESKEPLLLPWLQNLRFGTVLIDVGANIGLVSILHCKLNSSNRALCVEPSPFNLRLLALNIFANNISEQVAVIQNPLSNSMQLANIEFRTTEEGGAMHVFQSSNSGNKLNFVTTSIDNVFETIKSDCDSDIAIKIDVDGAELEVLKGAIKTLRLDKVTNLYIEVDFTEPTKANTILNLIEQEANFVCTSHEKSDLNNLLRDSCAVSNLTWRKRQNTLAH